MIKLTAKKIVGSVIAVLVVFATEGMRGGW